MVLAQTPAKNPMLRWGMAARGRVLAWHTSCDCHCYSVEAAFLENRQCSCFYMACTLQAGGRSPQGHALISFVSRLRVSRFATPCVLRDFDIFFLPLFATASKGGCRFRCQLQSAAAGRALRTGRKAAGLRSLLPASVASCKELVQSWWRATLRVQKRRGDSVGFGRARGRSAAALHCGRPIPGG